MRAAPGATPRARAAGLVVRPLAGDLLVYDLARQRAHSLAPAAAIVWRHCDGRRTVGEIAQAVARETAAPADARLVGEALAQPDRARLLDPPGAWAPAPTRRQALRATLAGAASLSLVTTIATPRPVDAASACTVPDSGFCFGSPGEYLCPDCGGGILRCCAIASGGTCCVHPGALP